MERKALYSVIGKHFPTCLKHPEMELEAATNDAPTDKEPSGSSMTAAPTETKEETGASVQAKTWTMSKPTETGTVAQVVPEYKPNQAPDVKEPMKASSVQGREAVAGTGVFVPVWPGVVPVQTQPWMHPQTVVNQLWPGAPQSVAPLLSQYRAASEMTTPAQSSVHDSGDLSIPDEPLVIDLEGEKTKTEARFN